MNMAEEGELKREGGALFSLARVLMRLQERKECSNVEKIARECCCCLYPLLEIVRQPRVLNRKSGLV